MSVLETATNSGDNSPGISRESLEQTFNTGKYFVVPHTLTFVLAVLSRRSNSALVRCWQHLPRLIFTLHGWLSRNSVDYSVHVHVSYPCTCIYVLSLLLLTLGTCTRVTVVILSVCVCVSVTKLAATYLLVHPSYPLYG